MLESHTEKKKTQQPADALLFSSKGEAVWHGSGLELFSLVLETLS